MHAMRGEVVKELGLLVQEREHPRAFEIAFWVVLVLTQVAWLGGLAYLVVRLT
jgi:hypothetical protein